MTGVLASAGSVLQGGVGEQMFDKSAISCNSKRVESGPAGAAPTLTMEAMELAPMADASQHMTTITVKLRLCDKHAAELNRQARAVNFAWNYCNEIQQKAASHDEG